MSGSEDPFALVRAAMVRDQVAARGVADPRVLAAMASVPRERFLPPPLRDQAYADRALPLGPGQTLSQPYIVAFMAEALRLQGHERVLEVGSGAGYFAAVLSVLASEVCGIELDPGLAARSGALLEELGIPNVRIRAGDGAAGWPEKAPFDAIVLSCAADELPGRLWPQLAESGVALLPESRPGGAQQGGALQWGAQQWGAQQWGAQQLVRHPRGPQGTLREALLPVAFVMLRNPA